MLISDKSTVVLISDVDSSNVKISRIKLDKMFGNKEIKSGRYISIWNNNCPTGTYPTGYNVKSGFSNDFIHAVSGIIGRYTGEIIINGVELYVIVNDEFDDEPEIDFVTFEEAIKACLKETE